MAEEELAPSRYKKASDTYSNNFFKCLFDEGPHKGQVFPQSVCERHKVFLGESFRSDILSSVKR